ncbi:MAG: tRNA lysidine(34) synthetase TilS, partial [Nitrospirae bacterium RBG_13_43_8]
MEELFQKVKKTIEKYFMLSGRERVLIALSGGPDSVCLLYILKNLNEGIRLDLHALYVNHGLRPEEAVREIEFCKNLCAMLNLPFLTKCIDVKFYAKEKKLNIQEAARELRYRVFEEAARELDAQKIALGHTADDQAETLLMRLLRGTGPAGLSGIPPVRGKFIRPLIEVQRKEIEQYLGEERVDFIVDSSNLKRDYLRNEIRLSLMPRIKEINPNIIDTLSRNASIFREEERYFEILVAKALMKLMSRKTNSRIELFLIPLAAMEKIILRRTLRRAIDETTGLRGINFIHIEDIIELVRRGKAGDRLYLPHGIRAIKGYSTLILTSDPPVKLDTYTMEVPGEVVLKEAGSLIRATIQESLELEEKDLTLTLESRLSTAAVFDADRLIFPLAVRPRKEGDFFYPLGFGKKKKIQDFFVDEKVPRDERDAIPLIVSGENIIWVIGYRGDERFKVTDETKRVL